MKPFERSNAASTVPSHVRTWVLPCLAGVLMLGLTTIAAAKEPAPTSGPRRLEDVHIEGEIPVPQVLFITTRDQRRFMTFQHRRYLRTSLELGEATPLPVWSIVVHTGPAPERKEIEP